MAKEKAAAKVDPFEELGSPKISEAEIKESAEPAVQDTEELLAELRSVSEEHYRWTSDKGEGTLRYEALRDAATAALEDGPRFFLDDHVKYVAVRVQSEPVEIDPEILKYLRPAVVDEIAPRKINNDAFKKAYQGGRIPRSLFIKHARIKPRRAFVKFVRYEDR